MESWYDVATPRPEVLAGRSFRPDEFAIALEQVVAGTAPDDYRQPKAFFDRTCFTSSLMEQAGLVLRRLVGQTQNTAPVLSLVSGFGGGKTHTLTALLHLARGGAGIAEHPSVRELLNVAGLECLPQAAVGVFVGNAWDPMPGRETPWIDLARQIAGEDGVAALGSAAVSSPPGTDALGRVLQAAGRPVLILCDEVINFTARHESLAEGFLAFLHNLTVTLTGTSRAAAVISLPQNAEEMTDRDRVWHERITKVVRRVARDLTGTGDGDVGEIIRRRLFEDCGSLATRQRVAAAYAEWCVDNRDRLPADWSAGDTTLSRDRLLSVLTDRFAASYPFHPATLSVFGRKWSRLPQFQQTRGMLAMLARWVGEAFERADAGTVGPVVQPLITLDSAPLHDADFRRAVSGQLGADGLDVVIDADIARLSSGAQPGSLPAHVEKLDADTSGPLQSIHRRVATAIWFESAGGCNDRIARLPELRLAVGEPQLDTTTIDSAAASVEENTDFVHSHGGDGYRFSVRPKIDRAARERQASLDKDRDVLPEVCRLVTDAFQTPSATVVMFPMDSAAVPDHARLTLIAEHPDDPWSDSESQRRAVAEWMRLRGASPRLYPGGLVFCFAQPGTALYDSVSVALAWRRIADEATAGIIGSEYESCSVDVISSRLAAAETRAREEVRSAYQTVVITDRSQSDDLRVVNVGDRSADTETSTAQHIITKLRAAAILSDSAGSGYLVRVWPPAFRDSGTWPLSSLLQNFFTGSLTRLLDAEVALREAIRSGVAAGDFALGAGLQGDGSFERIWRQELCPAEAIRFDANHALLDGTQGSGSNHDSDKLTDRSAVPGGSEASPAESQTGGQISITGSIPPELWNRIGTKILARLKSAGNVKVDVSITAACDETSGAELVETLRQTLSDLGIADRVDVRLH